jgi:predicted ATP-grasp superfamily ATP-dependent carboligase
MLSRYADGRYYHPDPKSDCEAFLDHLVAFLERNPHEVVFPSTDPLVVLLARERERVERTGVVVATEDWETLDRVNDKAKLYRLTRELDITQPETHLPRSLADVEELADEVSYPALVKPRSKSVWDDDGAYHMHVARVADVVNSPAALREQYRETLDGNPHLAAAPPMVQSYVPGEIWDVGTLAHEGEIVRRFHYRLARTYPSDGGVGALNRAVEPEPAMLEPAERIVDALDWTGPIQFEYIRRSDGTFVLMDVNGRYWGSIAMARRAGVDVPWLHYRQLAGDPPNRRLDYRTDVAYQKVVYGDLPWLYERLSRGDIGAVGTFLATLVRTENTSTLSDPLPTVGTLLYVAEGAARRVGDALRSAVG